MTAISLATSDGTNERYHYCSVHDCDLQWGKALQHDQLAKFIGYQLRH